jgi:hypothetical protein
VNVGAFITLQLMQKELIEKKPLLFEVRPDLPLLKISKKQIVERTNKSSIDYLIRQLDPIQCSKGAFSCAFFCDRRRILVVV